MITGIRRIAEKIHENKSIRFIDSRIINPSTRYRGLSIFYIVLACVALLHHVYATVYFERYAVSPPVFWIPWLIFIILGVFLGKMWRDKVFWILLALYLMKYLRLAIPEPETANAYRYIYRMCLYSFFGCYSIGRVLSDKDRKVFLIAFCAVWTLSAVVLFSLGLYTCWTGIEIPNLSSSAVRIEYNRLYPIYYPVDAGVLASVSIAVALIGISLTKKKIIIALYILGILILLLGGAMTVTRMNYIINALLVCTFAVILLQERRKTYPRKQRRSRAGRYVMTGITVMAFIIVAIALTFAQTYIVPGFNALRQKGLIPVAMAENGDSSVSETDTVQVRPFEFNKGMDEFLNGRIGIWYSVLIAAERDPSLFLYGASIDNPLPAVDRVREELKLPKVYHAHNTLVQTFLENGLPGFLLYLAFFLIFVWHAIYLLWKKDLPVWQRLLPLPTAACWIGDMMDCTAYVNFGKPSTSILFVFTGLTIAVSLQIKNRKNDKAAIIAQ